MIFGAIATNWTRSVRNRKGYSVDVRVSGQGKHGKHLCFTLVRGEIGKQERLDVTISGEAELKSISELISRTLVSQADFIGSASAADPPLMNIELALAPLCHRSEGGAAIH